MWGLNPFAPMAPDVDPLDLQKVRGLLARSFSSNPMGAENPMNAGDISAPVPQLPSLVGQPLPNMAPDIPTPPRRPETFGGEQQMPSLVGQPMPDMTPTPQQRAMEASSAGKPQDVRPSDPISGFDSGLDKMMTDPLFHMGVALLANPRNPGQGLAAGLQGWSAASRQAKRDKMAEEQAKRKNIHWFMRPDGTLAGVNADNPNELVVPPGQTPKNTQGEILQAGQEGVPQGFVGVRNPGGNISLHPLQAPGQPDKYEPILDDSGNPVAQRNLKTGKVEADPRAAGGVSAPKLTETDKKEIAQADESLNLAKSSMSAIKMARELSKGASQNPFSAAAAPLASSLGSSWGQKTEQLQNILTGEGLNNLKAAFGGNPTEGERKVQLELMGAMGQPDAVRQKIFDNYERVLKERMNFNLARSQALRDRSYYDPSSAFYKKFREYIEAETALPGGETQGAATGSVEAAPAGAGAPVQAAPQAGMVSKGYRFKGGDPSKKDNWERVQ